MLKEKFIFLNANIRKEGRFQINSLRFHLKNLESKSKYIQNRQKENIRAETNEIRNRKT